MAASGVVLDLAKLKVWAAVKEEMASLTHKS
jgi:hypothetical protein